MHLSTYDYAAVVLNGQSGVWPGLAMWWGGWCSPAASFKVGCLPPPPSPWLEVLLSLVLFSLPLELLVPSLYQLASLSSCSGWYLCRVI